MPTKTQPTYLQSDELSRQPVHGSIDFIFFQKEMFFFFFFKKIIQFFSICAQIRPLAYSRVLLNFVAKSLFFTWVNSE